MSSASVVTRLVTFASIPNGTVFWLPESRHDYIKKGRVRAYTHLRTSGKRVMIDIDPEAKIRIEYRFGEACERMKLTMRFDMPKIGQELLLPLQTLSPLNGRLQESIISGV